MHRHPRTKKLIDKHKQQYVRLKAVKCAVIGDYVYFNMFGFKHLIFKGKHRRDTTAIFNRLVLIPLIVPTIKNCDEILETRIRKEIIDGKKVVVTYHALESHVGQDSVRVRVVVRKVGDRGKFFFYSVMKY